jgi:hypothetical protein
MSVTLAGQVRRSCDAGKKKTNQILTVAIMVARNPNEDMAAPMVGFAFGGSLESGGRFCVGAFGRNQVSVAVEMFSHLTSFTTNFINFVLSLRFANAAINCITVQHTKFIPVNFDGSYYASC